MHCPRCNYPLTAEDKVCPRCGSRVDGAFGQGGVIASGAPPQYGGNSAYQPTTPLSSGFGGQVSGERHLQGQMPVTRYKATRAPRRWSVFALLGVVLFFGVIVGASLLITSRTTGTGPLPKLRIGPSFKQVDSRMDGRMDNWTEAQQESYWQNVVGTQVTWRGEVVDVALQNGGTIQLKCNPKTWRSDTHISLDGRQMDKLASVNKGQQVTVRGILEDHNTFGYTLSHGHIVAF